MRRLIALVALSLSCVLCPTARAQAPGVAVLPSVPMGRLVLVEIEDGARIKGRVMRIPADGVVNLVLRR